VLASLLFMRRIARMTRLAPVVVDVPDDVLVLRVIGPLFFAAAGTLDWHPAGHTLCSLAKSLAGSSGANNGDYRNLHTCVLA
ncbi:hypothetical protein MMO01_29710, partial [Escherichia coli]|nr:hypothetical protein [Escherichia coli]